MVCNAQTSCLRLHHTQRQRQDALQQNSIGAANSFRAAVGDA